MGYNTDFDGSFALDKPLAEDHKRYLQAFSSTRRMKRNVFLTVDRDDPIREAVGLPVGDDGCYFVSSEGLFGQEHADDIVDYNCPPAGQPDLWCQWVPNEDGTNIEWDGGKKFYSYVEWLQYLVEHFLKPWGYELSGEVKFQGENDDDSGVIVAEKNVVTTRPLPNPTTDLQEPKRFRISWWTGSRALGVRSAYADTEETAYILYALINDAMLGDHIDVEEFVDGEYKSTIGDRA